MLLSTQGCTPGAWALAGPWPCEPRWRCERLLADRVGRGYRVGLAAQPSRAEKDETSVVWCVYLQIVYLPFIVIILDLQKILGYRESKAPMSPQQPGRTPCTLGTVSAPGGGEAALGHREPRPPALSRNTSTRGFWGLLSNPLWFKTRDPQFPSGTRARCECGRKTPPTRSPGCSVD